MVGKQFARNHPSTWPPNVHRQPGSAFKQLTRARRLSQGSPQHQLQSHEKIFKVPQSKHEVIRRHNYSDTTTAAPPGEATIQLRKIGVRRSLALGRPEMRPGRGGHSPAVARRDQANLPHRHERGIRQTSTNPRWSSDAIDPGVTPLGGAQPRDHRQGGERVGGQPRQQSGRTTSPRIWGMWRSTRATPPTADNGEENSPKKIRALSRERRQHREGHPRRNVLAAPV